MGSFPANCKGPDGQGCLVPHGCEGDAGCPHAEEARKEWGYGTGIIGCILDDIIVERQRHRELYPSSVSRSPAEWLAIIGGEFGEVCDEVLQMTVFDQENHDEYWKEMVQVAACAIAALESMYLRKRAHEERMERRRGESS